MGMDIGASYSINTGILSGDYTKMNTNSSNTPYKIPTYEDFQLTYLNSKSNYKYY